MMASGEVSTGVGPSQAGILYRYFTYDLVYFAAEEEIFLYKLSSTIKSELEYCPMGWLFGIFTSFSISSVSF
ncbi:hypothetical protein D3C78_1873980 [compost metagenome]